MIRSPCAQPAAASRAPSRWALALFAVALIAINLLAFRHAIGWDVFHNSDSQVMLGVAGKAGWRAALGWITGPWVGAPLCLYYRPSSSWLMWVEWALFEWDAAGYQWVSMALHLMAALLFWRIAARLLGSETLAALAALLFSLRPRNVRTLAVLTAQPDLVAAAFMFLSLLALLIYLRSTSKRRGLLLAGSLAAAVISLGGKEMALSLPLLGSLIILFDRESPRRRKAWLLGAYWLTFAAFMCLRTYAMSGLGYIPKGWRDPVHAISALARSEGLYIAYPFTSAVMTREWWAVAMFAVVCGYAAAVWRWPVLRRERVILYGVVPGFIAVALGAAMLFYGDWVGALTPYPWELLGAMLVYAAGAGLIIARDRRAALFVLVWGMVALVPAAYRVHDWPGKFFYIPQTFWALAGGLLADALFAVLMKRRAAVDHASRPSRR